MSLSYGFYETAGKNLGSTYKVAASPCQFSKESEVDDATFSVKVKRTGYQCISGAKKIYCVYLNKESYIHWYIILHHEAEGTTYPFLTIEISSSGKDCVNITPKMNILEQEKINTKWKLSDIEIKLDTLCEIADKIVTEMGDYNVLTSNCQHFCNNLLLKLGVIDKPFSTSVGPDISKNDLTHKKYNMVNMTL